MLRLHHIGSMKSLLLAGMLAAILLGVAMYGDCLVSVMYGNLGAVALVNGLSDSTTYLNSHEPSPLLQVAETGFREALRRSPLDSRSYRGLGLVYMAQGDWANAEQAFRSFASAYPNDVLVYLYLGDLYAAQGDMTQAISCWTLTQAGSLFLGRARDHLRDDRLSEAEAELRLAAQFTDHYPPYLYNQLSDRYFQLGNLYREAGKLDQAITAYQEAVRIIPSQANYRIVLGVAYREAGLLEEALVELREATSTDVVQWKARAYGELGVTYRIAGRPDEAIAAFSQALEVNPGAANYRILRAAIYRDKGWIDEALRELEQAVQTENEDWRAWAYSIMGGIYRTEGNLDEALNAWQKAVDEKPDQVSYRLGLAMVLEEKGLFEQACIQYRKVLELDPGNEQAKMRISALECRPS